MHNETIRAHKEVCTSPHNTVPLLPRRDVVSDKRQIFHDLRRQRATFDADNVPARGEYLLGRHRCAHAAHPFAGQLAQHRETMRVHSPPCVWIRASINFPVLSNQIEIALYLFLALLSNPLRAHFIHSGAALWGTWTVQTIVVCDKVGSKIHVCSTCSSKTPALAKG
jgi:hypothetical protein